MRKNKHAPQIDLSALLQGTVTGRTRELWEHLSGRAKHSFGLGARGCQTKSGLWLLNVDGNRFYTVAIESDGELWQVGQVHTATPAVVAIVDQMTVFESDESKAKAKREQLAAEYGHDQVEILMRRHLWHQDVHEPKGGYKRLPEPEAPPRPSTSRNSMDDLLTTEA